MHNSVYFDTTDVDDEPPVVTCPDDIITNITSVWHCEQIIWEEPGSNNVDIQLVSRSSSPGDCFDIGTTPVIYEFRDLASNTGYCQFSVTVLGKYISIYNIGLHY